MFGIKLDADNRIVDFVNESHITDGMITLAELPEGFLRDNVYTDDGFACLPLPFGNDETSPCATTTEERLLAAEEAILGLMMGA